MKNVILVCVLWEGRWGDLSGYVIYIEWTLGPSVDNVHFTWRGGGEIFPRKKVKMNISDWSPILLVRLTKGFGQTEGSQKLEPSPVIQHYSQWTLCLRIKECSINVGQTKHSKYYSLGAFCPATEGCSIIVKGTEHPSYCSYGVLCLALGHDSTYEFRIGENLRGVVSR